MKIRNIPFYLKQAGYLFPMLLGYVLSLFTRKSGGSHDVWLLMERGFDAQDNAWHLMKYLHRSHPEIDVRYAIKKYSHDIEKLRDCKNAMIDYGSIRYYMCLYNATVIASTHIGTYLPSLWLKGKLEGTFLIPEGKKVFLQHGILHNNIAQLHYPYNEDLKLFVCGARNEFELVSERYQYPKGIVQYCGLARFDNLHDFKTNRTILFMPTWRIKYKYYSDEQFKTTDYYQSYKQILNSKSLKDCLVKNGYRLIFINHVEFQKFNHLFECFNDSMVEILSLKTGHIQNLLKDADVLVTDYSSVYYDFIYMGKPVIFYHINKDMFYDGQYGRDYDNVSDFGVVAESVQELSDSIISLIHNNCMMDERFIENMDRIFPLRDKNNCQRITEAILNI